MKISEIWFFRRKRVRWRVIWVEKQYSNERIESQHRRPLPRLPSPSGDARAQRIVEESRNWSKESLFLVLNFFSWVAILSLETFKHYNELSIPNPIRLLCSLYQVVRGRRLECLAKERACHERLLFCWHRNEFSCRFYDIEGNKRASSLVSWRVCSGEISFWYPDCCPFLLSFAPASKLRVAPPLFAP